MITYQWGFKYATSTDPSRPSTWTAPTTLLNGDPTGGTGTGPIDQTVICDSTNCYLFFAGDNGHIYRASMPIGNFPGTFSNATSIMSDTTNNPIDACNLQFLYQGFDKTMRPGDYSLIPYRPALLTLSR